MPNYPVLSFNSGELSPQIDARSDVEKYQAGCRILENMIPRIYGGAVRRPGTKYISLLNKQDSPGRVIPFIYSNEIAYVVLLEDQEMRFFYDGGVVLDAIGREFELQTDYLAADIPTIQFAQSNDVMWLVHGSYPQAKLTRVNANEFTIADITFTNGPFLKRNDLANDDGVTLTPSVTTGTGTLTASAATFQAGHVGSLWKLVQPRAATILEGSYTSPATGTTATILVEGTFTFTTHGTWTGTIALERNADGAGWETFRTWLSADDRNIQYTGDESEDNVLYRVNVSALSSGTVSFDLTINSSTQEGIARVTGFTSTTVVSITVLKDFASTDATVRWHEGCWSGVRGYPITVTFFEGRCWYAGTTHQPQTIWASAVDDFENFEECTKDDSSFWLTMSSGTRNAIRWIAALDALLVGTTGGEWRLRSNTYDEPITPTNYSCKQQTSYGSAAIQAITVNDAILFVDFVKRKVRELTYSGDKDKFVAPDLSALAEHITEGDIEQIAFQKNPDPILWITRADGMLLSMTYEREQNVVAWAKHFTSEPTEITSGATTEVEGDLSDYEFSYIAANDTLIVVNEDLTIRMNQALPAAGAMTLDLHPTTGEMAIGQNASIVKRDANGTLDTTYYVPTAGWPAMMDVVRGLRYTADGNYLYASIVVRAATDYTTIYKFEVATGDEVWNISYNWVTFGLCLDSNENVYCPAAHITPFGVGEDSGVQQFDSDGNVGTGYGDFPGNGLFLAYDVWVDTFKDIVLAVGNDYDFPSAVWTQLACWRQSTGELLWTLSIEDNSARELYSVKTRMDHDDYIYVAGDRMTNAGTTASVWKIDLDGNIVDSYDTGGDATYCYFTKDDQFVIKGNSSDKKLYILDTDLTYQSDIDVTGVGIYGAEAMQLPYDLTDRNLTTITTASEGQSALSVCTIPGSTEDEIWLCTARVINGTVTRFVEQMQPRNYGDQEDSWFVDCGLDYDGVAADEFTGLDHLNGEEIAILGDGAVFPAQTVSGGAITLTEEVSRAIMGLAYRYTLKPMRFDLTSRQGTSKGSIKVIREVVISFFETLNAQYGIDASELFDIDWRGTEALGEPPALYTGDKIVVSDSGFDVEDSIIISGADPLPCLIRAIVPRLEVTGR